MSPTVPQAVPPAVPLDLLVETIDEDLAKGHRLLYYLGCLFGAHKTQGEEGMFFRQTAYLNVFTSKFHYLIIIIIIVLQLLQIIKYSMSLY